MLEPLAKSIACKLSKQWQRAFFCYEKNTKIRTEKQTLQPEFERNYNNQTGRGK
jgi:hypothetical protein